MILADSKTQTSAVTREGRDCDYCREGGLAAEMERILALALELRLSIHTASATLNVIVNERVGIQGSAGTILKEILQEKVSIAQTLVERLLTEIHGTRLIARSASP